MESISKNRPNWLLRGLISVSFGIHLVIFMHIAGIYQSSALTCIELALKDISKPVTRSIPRPRHRPKETPIQRDVKRLVVFKRPMPLFKPISLEPDEKYMPDSVSDRISVPHIPVAPGLNFAQWVSPKTKGPPVNYKTSSSYLDMVLLRIEHHKKYPDAARIRQIEGRTSIHFVIEPDGNVSSIDIMKSAGNRALDKAAVNAVREASPFPRPPAHLFRGAISLKLDIIFELT